MLKEDDIDVDIISVSREEFARETMGRFTKEKSKSKLGKLFEKLESGEAKIQGFHKIPNPSNPEGLWIIIIPVIIIYFEKGKIVGIGFGILIIW